MRDTSEFRFTLTDADLRKMHLKTAAAMAASMLEHHLQRRAADDVYTHAVRAFHFATLYLDA